jgi:hypothetical protein
MANTFDLKQMSKSTRHRHQVEYDVERVAALQNVAVQIIDIGVNHPSTTKLIMKSQGLAEGHFIPLMHSLSHNDFVDELNFERNRVADEGLLELGKILITNRSIKDINLNYNDYRDSGARELALGLKDNPIVRTLQLRCAPSVEQRRSRQAKAPVGILGPGCASLAGVLAMPTCMIVLLDLSFNQIMCQGAMALGKGLKKNSVLKTLLLAGNDIADLGARALGDLITDNFTLEKLDVSYNTYSDAAMWAVCNAVVFRYDHNDLTLKLLLEENYKMSDKGYSECTALLKDMFARQVQDVREREEREAEVRAERETRLRIQAEERAIREAARKRAAYLASFSRWKREKIKRKGRMKEITTGATKTGTLEWAQNQYNETVQTWDSWVERDAKRNVTQAEWDREQGSRRERILKGLALPDVTWETFKAPKTQKPLRASPRHLGSSQSGRLRSLKNTADLGGTSSPPEERALEPASVTMDSQQLLDVTTERAAAAVDLPADDCTDSAPTATESIGVAEPAPVVTGEPDPPRGGGKKGRKKGAPPRRRGCEHGVYCTIEGCFRAHPDGRDIDRTRAAAEAMELAEERRIQVLYKIQYEEMMAKSNANEITIVGDCCAAEMEIKIANL